MTEPRHTDAAADLAFVRERMAEVARRAQAIKNDAAVRLEHQRLREQVRAQGEGR